MSVSVSTTKERMGDMAKTIRARFSHGVIEPLEKVEYPEGEELEITIEEKDSKVEVKKEKINFAVWPLGVKGNLTGKEEVKTHIHYVKADAFLKHADLVSVGGDAVKEANHYDE